MEAELTVPGTIVLIVIALFQAFGVDSSISKAGFWTKFFVFLAFVFLESTAAGYAFATAQGDPAGASVIAWALFSICMLCPVCYDLTTQSSTRRFRSFAGRPLPSSSSRSSPSSRPSSTSSATFTCATC